MLASICLLPVDGDLVRTQSVGQLVEEDMGEEPVEAQVLLLIFREDDGRNRDQRLLELGFLNVLQHHALGALLGNDALIVWQVIRGGLDAVVAVARAINLVHNADWR